MSGLRAPVDVVEVVIARRSLVVKADLSRFA